LHVRGKKAVDESTRLVVDCLLVQGSLLQTLQTTLRRFLHACYVGYPCQLTFYFRNGSRLAV